MSEDSWLTESGFDCPWEEEPLSFGDPVALISVAIVAQEENGRVRFDAALTAARDDLLHTPNVLSDSGWEAVVEQLEASLEETPARKLEDQYGVCRCNFCESSIRPGEVVVTVQLGELHRSQRSPNGKSGGVVFEPYNNPPTLVCLACENRLHDETVALWTSPVRQHRECDNGTLTRCWRNGCSAQKGTCALVQQAAR